MKVHFESVGFKIFWEGTNSQTLEENSPLVAGHFFGEFYWVYFSVRICAVFSLVWLFNNY